MNVDEAIEWLQNEGVLAQNNSVPITHDAWDERAHRDVAALGRLRAALVGIKQLHAQRTSEVRSWLTQYAQNEAQAPGAANNANAPPIELGSEDNCRRHINAFHGIDRETRHAVSVDDGSDVATLVERFERVNETQRQHLLNPPGPGSGATAQWLVRAGRPVAQLERQQGAFDRALDRAMDRIDTFLSDDPSEVFDNPHGVVLNFRHASLIPVTNSSGTGLIRHRIDPIFAVRVVCFLRAVKLLNYTRIYSNGFTRDPKRPVDRAHPAGRAWDIAGFDYGHVRYHLASGRPPEEFYGRRAGRIGHERNGASSWFGRIGLHREATEVAAPWELFRGQLIHYFGEHTHIGPGHNASHMNHFHVQMDVMRSLERRGEPGAPATSSNPRPYRNNRR